MNLDRDRARQEIRTRISCKDYLVKSKAGLYECPYCGSGNGPHGTGALKVYDTNTWHCFACQKSGDVIDLFRRETGADYNTALSLMAQEIGITIDSYRTTAQAEFSPTWAAERPAGEDAGQTGIDASATSKRQQGCIESPIEPQAAD